MRTDLLTDLLWSLTDDDRQRVSSIRITRDVYRGWLATLSYAGMATVRRERDDDRVTVTDRARRPDTTHELVGLSGADPQDDVAQAVRALHASGLVGSLDASRYESDTLDAMTRQPFPAWLIKTHAGSDAERLAWLCAIDDHAE